MPRVTYPFRATQAGGIDIVYVFTPSGERVKPILKIRSRSGTHGYDVFELGPGVYYTVWLSRPNNPTKPVSVKYRRLIVDASGVKGIDATESELPPGVINATRRILVKIQGA